jgi:hypothetical protein
MVFRAPMDSERSATGVDRLLSHCTLTILLWSVSIAASHCHHGKKGCNMWHGASSIVGRFPCMPTPLIQPWLMNRLI